VPDHRGRPGRREREPATVFPEGVLHNGYAKSLKQLVHFYNTRDVFAHNVTSGQCPAGTTEKVDCWPMPEVRNNIDMTVGNLGLTDQEEDLIVIALQPATDGFDPATRPSRVFSTRTSIVSRVSA
jgi:hypothetical protein